MLDNIIGRTQKNVQSLCSCRPGHHRSASNHRPFSFFVSNRDAICENAVVCRRRGARFNRSVRSFRQRPHGTRSWHDNCV